MKILIAEDDVVAAKVLRLTLENLGHEVISARHGAEAWEMFHREPPRVVVSDWMMPEMDGLDFCRKVRDRTGTPYTYFVLLTAAHTGPEAYTEAMDAGVDDFLTKPLNRELIRSRLRVAARILHFTTEVRSLKELIPVCAYCRRVREDEGYLQSVENYINAQTGCSFSHGICPECMEQQMQLMAPRSSEGGEAASVDEPGK